MTRTLLPLKTGERFCPDCHRQLVRIGSNGALRIAYCTRIRVFAVGEETDEGEWVPPDAAYISDAICLLPKCLIKTLRRRVATTRRNR